MPRLSVRARQEAIAIERQHGTGAAEWALGAYNSAAGPQQLAHAYDVLRGVLEIVHRKRLARVWRP